MCKGKKLFVSLGLQSTIVETKAKLLSFNFVSSSDKSIHLWNDTRFSFVTLGK